MELAASNNNAILQREELEVITSIYTDCFEIANDDYGKIEALFRYVPTEPTNNYFQMVVSDCACVSERGEYGSFIKSTKTTTLPPVTLLIRLPSGYPEKEKPEIEISCIWLSAHSQWRLLERLNEISGEAQESGSGALFSIFDFIQNKLLEFVGISPEEEFDLCTEFANAALVTSEATSSKSNAAAACSTSTANSNSACSSSGIDTRPKFGRTVSLMRSRCSRLHRVLAHVNEFDKSVRLARFRDSRFECPVCLSEVLGSEATQIDGCEHGFCKACLRAYISEKVGSGQVLKIECGEDGCEQRIPEWQIKEAVGDEVYAQYEARALEVGLQTLEDVRVHYCPRATCSAPVLLEKKRDGEFETVGVCTECLFAFCTKCQQANHGVASCEDRTGLSLPGSSTVESEGDCQTSSLVKFLHRFVMASAEQRENLVKYYGLSMDGLRERFKVATSEVFVSVTSKPCPSCRAMIHKESGCNKMACSRCGVRWCYVCSAIIDSYDHFKESKNCNLWANAQFSDLVDLDTLDLERILPIGPEQTDEANAELS